MYEFAPNASNPGAWVIFLHPSIPTRAGKQGPVTDERSMTETVSIKSETFSAIKGFLEQQAPAADENTPLIGDGSSLDSLKLVELCIFLEDKASEMGFEFDWTSDVAMSRSRSMFRTIGSLTTEFLSQMEAQKR
jgi:acyl carrier protein